MRRWLIAVVFVASCARSSPSDLSRSDTQVQDPGSRDLPAEAHDAQSRDDAVAEAICTTTCHCCGNDEVMSHDCSMQEPCRGGFCDWWCLGDPGIPDVPDAEIDEILDGGDMLETGGEVSVDAGCPPDKPFPSDDGQCWECHNDTNCGLPDWYCDPLEHRCLDVSVDGCIGDRKECPDRSCIPTWMCCTDADCVGVPDATGACVEHVCAGADPCKGTCVEPGFDHCVVSNMQPLCVDCLEDSDCADAGIDCQCDPYYTCMCVR